MRSALIHGVLLAVMLVYGYRTWTRDKSVKPDLGSVSMWSKSEDQLAFIEYKSEKKTVRLDRKTDAKAGYWWGTETSIEKKPKPKPPEPKPAGTGSGSGSAAGSGSAGSSAPAGSAAAGSAAKAGSGSAVATGSGSAAPPRLGPAKTGSGSAVAAGSGSAKTGSGSAVAAGSGSAAKTGSGSAVAAGSAKAGSGSAVAGSGSAKTGSGSGSAVAQGSGVGSGSAGSGSAAKPPPPPPVEMVETTRRREFPLGDDGDKLVKAWADAHAISELASPTADQLVEYKLASKEQIDAKLTEVKKELEDVKAQEAKEKEEEKDKDPKDKKKKKDDKKPELNKKIKDLEEQKKNADKPKPTITIGFADGTTRVFTIGGNVFGATPDRYALDKSGTVYVLSKDMVADLELGESKLQLKIPNGFDPTKEADQVDVVWGERKKTAKRSQGGVDEKQVKTWSELDGKSNQPLATFIDNINNLRPTEYAKDVKLDTVQPIVRLEYRDAKGGRLGTLALYKVEKPPLNVDPDQFDPANPPKGEMEYYVVTERTRVPALVRKDPAQKSEEDLPIVFGDKAAPVAPKPGSNPFGNVPIPGGHGGHGSGKP